MNCLNCGATLTGAFCAACGQRDVPPYPSVRELAVDAVTEFSGWDGRLASTLRALARRPGLLTKEFLEGRRARYISPLRLYLSASVIYFLLAASAPKVGEERGLRVRATTSESDSLASGARRVGDAATAALDKGRAATAEERRAAVAEVARRR